MNSTTVAIDVAKSVFEIAVSDHPGRVRQRHRLSRLGLMRWLGKAPASIVLMEACGSAHHWGREIHSYGHSVQLLPAHDVRRYRTGNKTDRADAKALLEAARNEEIHPVPLKTVDQQALGGLHRLRSRWMATRTARINTIRGILREFGTFIPQGAHLVMPRVLETIRDPDSSIPSPLRPILELACDEIREIQDRIRSAERQLQSLAVAMPQVTQFRTIPGVGILTATAVEAFVGPLDRFPSGRHFASYLGLTPRERSSGLTRNLGPITKRGDKYIRMLLVHGARTTLWHAKKQSQPDPLRTWALALEQHRGHNIAAVALANRIARILWAVSVKKEDYRTQRIAS